MATVKTAISLQGPLFEKAERLARKKKVSRSRLFVMALEDYVRREEGRHLLERINRAYEGSPDAEEKKRQRMMRQSHRRVVEGEW